MIQFNDLMQLDSIAAHEVLVDESHGLPRPLPRTGLVRGPIPVTASSRTRRTFQRIPGPRLDLLPETRDERPRCRACPPACSPPTSSASASTSPTGSTRPASAASSRRPDMAIATVFHPDSARRYLAPSARDLHPLGYRAYQPLIGPDGESLEAISMPYLDEDGALRILAREWNDPETVASYLVAPEALDIAREMCYPPIGDRELAWLTC